MKFGLSEWKIIVVSLATIIALALFFRSSIGGQYFSLIKRLLGLSRPALARKSDGLKSTPKQLAARRSAIVLVREGKAAQAAEMLEKVGLVRDAVSVLEDARLIDEACAILVRINRPSRAAAVYARHAKHVQAAELYLVAQMPDEAAEQFLAAGRASPEFYEKAANIYEQLQKFDLAMRSYELQRNHEKVITIAFQNGLMAELSEYMKNDDFCATVLRFADKSQLEALFAGCSASREFVPVAVKWSRISGKSAVIALSIRKFLRDGHCLANFWFHLPSGLAARTISEIVSGVAPVDSHGLRYLTRNGRALFDAKLYEGSAELYFSAQRYAMAAKTFALCGKLSKAVESLRLLNDSHISNCFSAALKSFGLPEDGIFDSKSISPEIISALASALDEIDPDNDAEAVRSPFSLVS